jgi:hypothetical protein
MSDGEITAALASFETKEEEVDDPLPNVPATRHRPVTVEGVDSSVGDDDDDPTNRYRESSSPEYPYSTSAQVEYSCRTVCLPTPICEIRGPSSQRPSRHSSRLQGVDH